MKLSITSVSNATAIVKKYRANPIENIQQLLNYTDPDHTISDFLSQMKDEFLNSIPQDTDDSLSTRKLIKNIKSLYRVQKIKGHIKLSLEYYLTNHQRAIHIVPDDMLRVSDKLLVC